MPPEETAPKSPLEKPLHLLTEDDISQLTREDCRRYLKEKGMRKPSWNKSQAIQQVISLKALLETTPDSVAGNRKKLYVPRPESNVHRVPKGTIAEAEFSESAEETVPYRRKHPERADLHAEVASLPVATAANDSAPSRTTDSVNTPVGQMTIFYCGKVNVFDDVPSDKAQAIMHLAASRLCVPFGTPLDATIAAQHSACHLQAASVKLGPDSAMVLVPTMQTVKTSEASRYGVEESNTIYEDNPVDGPANRKASVQRYLEKRKDRFKSKRKVGITSSASLDIYTNQQIGNHTPKEHSSWSDTCSPPPIRLSTAPTPSGPIENNIQMNVNVSAGLSDKDAKE